MEKIPVFSIIILHHEPIKHHHHPRPAQKIATFSPVASLHQRPQRWLCRTIQLRRRLVACHPGDDCHTSTKKSSRSIETRAIKKHLNTTMVVGRASGHCRHSSIEHPAVAGYDDTIDVSDEQWRRTWTEVRWNGVFSHDIKSGGVERMISLRQRRFLSRDGSFKSAPNPIDTGCTV